MERAAETKSEYDDGVVYAMAGAAEQHNLIVWSLLTALGNRLGPNCRAYPSDMKVRLWNPTRFFYPDVTIVCGQSQFDDNERDVLLNPLIVFEVLSETTERHDRGRKFNAYQTIETLREFVLVSSEDHLVEHFRRVDDEWRYSKAEGLDANLPLAVANCDLPLREIYHRADLPA